MSTNKRGTRYDEEFKRTLVNLYQTGGKTQAALCKEYGIALQSAVKQLVVNVSDMYTPPLELFAEKCILISVAGYGFVK